MSQIAYIDHFIRIYILSEEKIKMLEDSLKYLNDKILFIESQDRLGKQINMYTTYIAIIVVLLILRLADA